MSIAEKPNDQIENPAANGARELTTTLSSIERVKLENFEETIQAGLKSFVDVGRALMEIRDGRLYRDTHGTFEDYCQDRWQLKRAHAYRLIDSAEVVDNLSPIGDILPATESQARPLTRIEPEQQAAVWQEAVHTAPQGKVTAKHVEEVVAKRKPKPVQAKPTESSDVVKLLAKLEADDGENFKAAESLALILASIDATAGIESNRRKADPASSLKAVALDRFREWFERLGQAIAGRGYSGKVSPQSETEKRVRDLLLDFARKWDKLEAEIKGGAK